MIVLAHVHGPHLLNFLESLFDLVQKLVSGNYVVGVKFTHLNLVKIIASTWVFGQSFFYYVSELLVV